MPEAKVATHKDLHRHLGRHDADRSAAFGDDWVDADRVLLPKGSRWAEIAVIAVGAALSASIPSCGRLRRRAARAAARAWRRPACHRPRSRRARCAAPAPARLLPGGDGGLDLVEPNFRMAQDDFAERDDRSDAAIDRRQHGALNSSLLPIGASGIPPGRAGSSAEYPAGGGVALPTPPLPGGAAAGKAVPRASPSSRGAEGWDKASKLRQTRPAKDRSAFPALADSSNYRQICLENCPKW